MKPTNISVQLYQELLELCRQGQKLEAIRRYKEATGSSLAEAKDIIDSFDTADAVPLSSAQHTGASSQHRAPVSTDQQVLDLCRQGNYLQAVKVYKDATGKGLKESKDYVDQLAAAHGIERPKGACFVATVCYGDYDAPEVRVLRRFRDEKLMKTAAGRVFVRLYYSASPFWAARIARSERAKAFVRRWILGPLVGRPGGKN